ncbi:hypothetical protein BKA70DRAFT_1229636 [Coprinopsis sp. MPI-PUGE-AT-0042]|nr:hypothetical protein BKA70DRAFT_1229636 [Coprinopsis sp. MPI-PUGE-AT-0042]
MGAVLSQVLWGVQVTGPLNVGARDVLVHNHIHYHRVESTGDVDIPPILESVPNFRGIQITTLGRATPGTGLWIVECETFRLWLDPDGWLRIMWGYGMHNLLFLAGAGKTIAASIVINALEAHATQFASPFCVCYIYFRYSDHTKATTRSFLEVLVKQTLERHPGCLPLFNKVYARHTREKTQPSEEELLGLLREFTGAMITFYVLDALDEAPTAIQTEIIQRLTSLNVKLFITSRPLKNMEATFPDVYRFPHFCPSEISLSGDLRTILEQGGILLRNEVYTSIKAKCGGMFLHATLQLATLCECASVHEVQQTLATFPTDIEDLYRETWQRILNLAPNKVSLAKNALTWVVHATRSLTIRELQEAVATCPNTHKYAPDRLVQENVLLGLCHGLITVEEGTRLVRLALCLARLTNSGFQDTTLKRRQELDKLLRADPILRYAYDSWSIHARQSLDSPLTTGRLAEFAQNCRHDGAVKELLQLPNISINTVDANGSTALITASRFGQEGAARLLVAHPDLNVNAANRSGWSALIEASEGGHEEVVTLLMSHPDVNVNVANQDDYTALAEAAIAGREDIVKLLLTHPSIQVGTRELEAAKAQGYSWEEERIKEARRCIVSLLEKLLDDTLWPSCI